MASQESAPKRNPKSGSRTLRVLDPAQNDAWVKARVKDVLATARRIERAAPRIGSFSDLEIIRDFADTFREEVIEAVRHRRLAELNLEIPGHDEVSAEIAFKVKPFPGLTVIMESTDSGLRKRIVGENYKPRIVKGPPHEGLQLL